MYLLICMKMPKVKLKRETDNQVDKNTRLLQLLTPKTRGGGGRDSYKPFLPVKQTVLGTSGKTSLMSLDFLSGIDPSVETGWDRTHMWGCSHFLAKTQAVQQ